MNKKDEKEIDEIMSELPEAPVSLTIRGYYKGFSILFTKRGTDTEANELLAKSISVVDWMIEHGFKPSWNEETNGKVHTPAVPQKKLPLCKIHMKAMKERTAPDGSVFYSHARQREDGAWEYCSGDGWKVG